jgi:hypothetical protein
VQFASGTRELQSVGRARLYETSHSPPQLRLFGLNALGEGGWLKALKLVGYAPRRRPSGPLVPQEAMFPYLDAL